MNREIKFRCGDKKENKMFLPDYVGSETCVINVDVESSGEGNYDHCLLKYNYNIKLMQFTGLHDKNGVEIYEGDVVRVLDIDLEDTDPKTGKFGRVNCDEIAEIKWRNIGWGFRINNTMWLYDGYRNIEVIGNVMENPDLLNK